MNPRVIRLSLLSLACVFAGEVFAQALEVTATGVGIGTTTPDGVLAVNGPTSSVIGISFGNASAGITASRYIGITRNGLPTDLGGNSGFSGLEFGGPESASEGFLAFHTHDLGVASGEKMRIDKSGNVGVGTSSPSNDLTIRQKTDTQSSAGVRVYRVNGSSSGVFFQGADDNTYLFNYGGGFRIFTNGTVDVMTIASAGNVGIGTASPTHKLTVSGPVRASQFIADVNTYSDFVFKPDYKLASLTEVETAIKRDGHLPDIPSEAKAKAEGLNIGEMQVKLLQKVEELTLYAIEQNKRIDALQRELDRIKK